MLEWESKSDTAKMYYITVDSFKRKYILHTAQPGLLCVRFPTSRPSLDQLSTIYPSFGFRNAWLRRSVIALLAYK